MARTNAPLLFSAVLPDTPLGTLGLQVTGRGLARVQFVDCPDQPCEEDAQKMAAAQIFAEAPLLLVAMEQLRDYFDGRRKEFDLPIDWQSIPPFQERVLKLALEIPYGQTRTYGDLAIDLGQPGASRAVGIALGKNPLPIVIPCHRVMGNQGHLRGYSAPDGLTKKAWLLKLEGVLLIG
jgi:methylated-DNA-[protein]-cysteine S-methyltransferase